MLRLLAALSFFFLASCEQYDKIPPGSWEQHQDIDHFIDESVVKKSSESSEIWERRFLSKYGRSGCLDLTGFKKYSSIRAMTVSGFVCQNWTSQTPHKHNYGNDSLFPFDGSAKQARNYCRDPDGWGRPWCYTTDSNVRWEYCDVPVCNKDCWVGGNTRLYYGKISITENRRTCQRWSSSSPHSHGNWMDELFPLDGTAWRAANYCRDPDRTGRLWCYTIDPDVRWEYCYVDGCA